MIYNSKDDSVVYSDVTNCCVQFYIGSLVCPFSMEETQNAAKEVCIKTIELEITCKSSFFSIFVCYFKYTHMGRISLNYIASELVWC